MLRSTGIDMYRLFWNVLDLHGFALIWLIMFEYV